MTKDIYLGTYSCKIVLAERIKTKSASMTYGKETTGTGLILSAIYARFWINESALSNAHPCRSEFETLPKYSVADPACLSRIRIFPSRIQGQRDSGPRIRIRRKLFKVFLTQKIVSKLSEIWSGMFIPDPGCWFFYVHICTVVSSFPILRSVLQASASSKSLDRSTSVFFTVTYRSKPCRGHKR